MMRKDKGNSSRRDPSTRDSGEEKRNDAIVCVCKGIEDEFPIETTAKRIFSIGLSCSTIFLQNNYSCSPFLFLNLYITVMTNFHWLRIFLNSFFLL